MTLFELMRTLRPLCAYLLTENLVARVRTADLEAYEVCDRVTHATRSPSTTLIDVNGDSASLLPLGPDFHLPDSTRRARWSDPESIDGVWC